MNAATSRSNTDVAIPVVHDLTLTTAQRSVHNELTRLDVKLANMYLGAIYVLRQEGNTDRISQSAHSLRELIEKLSLHHAAPIAGGPGLKERVLQLRGNWPESAIETFYDDPTNSLSSARPVHRFLNKVRKFFEWFDQTPATRRERFGQFLAVTDPRRRRLPQAIEKAQIRRWLDVREGLLKIAHHGPCPLESEFQKLFDRLDILLIEGLRPKAFEEQDEIDRIITQGEAQT